MSPLLLRRLTWLVLALVVTALWWGTLDAPFVYDDKVEVIGNRTIRVLDRWRAIVAYNLSRPLTILSYAWDFSRSQLDPRGYHVANLVVHVAAVGAALELAVASGRLFKVDNALWRAILGTGLWAIHPMVTESVTYTTGRSETLCGTFAFLALAAWATGLEAERTGGRGWPWRLAGLAAFLLSATSKEVGWTVPAIALGMEVLAPGRKEGPRLWWLWYAPFAGLLGAGLWLRLQQAGALLPREADRTLLVQLTTSAEVWRRYLLLWLVPVGQTLFHDVRDADPASTRGVLAWGGWIALVAGGVWLGWRRKPVGWALLAAALVLLPSTSFVVLKEHMAEHRTYQFGLYLLLALTWLVPAGWLSRATPVAAALAALLAWATLQRNAVWGSEVTLWKEATARVPDSAEAWYGLGDARRFADDFAGARAAYARSAELDPDRLDTWNNLGIAAAEVGDFDEARRAWERALRVKPSYCRGHNNLGSLAYRQGQWDVAITELRSTLSYCPTDPIAHYLLGNIFFEFRRDKTKAQVHYEAVVEFAPQFDHIGMVKQRLLELTW